eukprot:TRINITY_DN315_c0_g1_i1.p1 TRINITY_DN315_c0_g1~~TRINITY_DN315_c0_g1_i1.p1  ORF type:complete len:331 (+),score=112.91 TRINITY_DN315_c0_g1_i1:70-1062(+)
MSFLNTDPWFNQFVPQQQQQQQTQFQQIQPGQFKEFNSPNAWVPVQDYQKPMISSASKNVYSTYQQGQIQEPDMVAKNTSPSTSPSPSPSPSSIKKKNDIEEEISTQNLYKTELCRSFQETGNCRYGSKCQFAHGAEELRPVLRHPKYKTEVCKTYIQTGHCPYGKRCRFIHSKPQSKPKAKQRPAYPDTSMLMAASPNLIAPQETPENNFPPQTFNVYNQQQANFSTNTDWSQINPNAIQSQITKNQLIQLQLQQQQLQQLQLRLQQQQQQQEQLIKLQANNNPQFQYSTNNSFDMNSMSNALPHPEQVFKTLPQTQSQSRLSFFQDLC